MDYLNRLDRVREKMTSKNIGMMFLTHGSNLFYLAGINRVQNSQTDVHSYGDYIFGAFIGEEGGFTIIAPRLGGSFYENEAKNKPWIENVIFVNEGSEPDRVLTSALNSFNLKGKDIAVDDRMWIKGGLILKALFPDSSFSPASEILDPMRMIKDSDEIQIMQKAGKITDDVYMEILNYLKVGVAEYDISHEIEHQFSQRGVDYPSFVTGVRFSRPGKNIRKEIIGPVRSGSNRLESGDAITFDFGACYQGYCSDFGRTAFAGEAPKEFLKIHDIVIKAQVAAINAMVSGSIRAMDLDMVARSFISEYGYENQFIHRLGHGIGVTVHEPPYLFKPDNTILKSGMTLAIEPSIIDLQGFFCRIEDVVMVTEEGGIPFTNFDKKLHIIS